MKPSTFYTEGDADLDSPHPPEIVRAALKTVCRNAVDADEARDLAAMLGLTAEGEVRPVPPKGARSVAVPNPGRCRRCGAETISRSEAPQPGKHGARLRRPDGVRRYGGQGMCEACRQQERRAAREATS